MSEIEVEGHKETLRVMDGVEWRQGCSCGAHWTQPRSRTEEFMAGLFQSHIAYAKRQATKVD